MEIESGRMQVPDVLCCMCGVTMKPNKVNTCADCLKSRHDITAEFAKNGVLFKCKRCERYQKATQGWIFCAPESKALLALCLKKIKGLGNVSLVDANFVWTEEHSKRIKVKLQVQKEVAAQVILQQTCVVEFVVQGKMCDDCHKQEANIGWDTIVQVRQKVDHKRTFLYLEQLILKHSEDQRTVSVEAKPEGVDFFFGARNDATRFVDFLETVVPMRYKTSKKIVSLDTKSNIATFNFTYAVEIVPICKDDLVFLPHSTAQKLGSISQLVICTHVTNMIRLVDPLTCQVAELSAEKFWQKPFRSLLSSPQLTEFIVLDVQLLPQTLAGSKNDQDDDVSSVATKNPKKRRRKGKSCPTVLSSKGVNLLTNHALAQIEVARDSDFGVNDKRYFVNSHLGYILKPGDSVLGYDVLNANTNDDIELKNPPDVILIRKHYPKWRKAQTKRSWELKHMITNQEKSNAMGLERDREQFMRDLEEDEEMRRKINLYKAKNHSAQEQMEDEIEQDVPKIDVEDLLDEMTINEFQQRQEQLEDDDDDDL